MPSHARRPRALLANRAEELVASQGQGLVAAMREVPSQFFQEGFSLDRAELWEEVRCVCGGGAQGLLLGRAQRERVGLRAPPPPPPPTQVCDVRDDEARQRSLERLSHYLDVVETHLVREIAARSGGGDDGGCERAWGGPLPSLPPS